jgi:hypothetical protein
LLWAHPAHIASLPPFPNRSMPPAEPGTYILVLRFPSARAISVGRLGTLVLSSRSSSLWPPLLAEDKVLQHSPIQVR